MKHDSGDQCGCASCRRPSKEDVKRAIDDVGELGLPDGAHWALIHEKLGLDYGDVFDIIAESPAFFGATHPVSS